MLTKKIIDAGSHVVGLDSSPDLCAAARRLGLEIVEMSASDMAFEKEFDAVFSNAALHWMKDADRVVEELNRRGYDGESASPWYFPSPAEYRAHLSAAGFDVPYIELIPRPTPIPDMMGWLTTFSHCFTALLPSDERRDYLESVQVRIRPRLCDEFGKWTADYTRLRFRAVLEGAAAPPEA